MLKTEQICTAEVLLTDNSMRREYQIHAKTHKYLSQTSVSITMALGTFLIGAKMIWIFLLILTLF